MTDPDQLDTELAERVVQRARERMQQRERLRRMRIAFERRRRVGLEERKRQKLARLDEAGRTERKESQP